MGKTIGGDEVHGDEHVFIGNFQNAHITIDAGPSKLSLAEMAALLAEHRTWLLADTARVDLRGIPLPQTVDGRRISLDLPLERIYVRLRAMPEERRRNEEEGMRRAIEEKAARAETDDYLRLVDRLGEYLYARLEHERTDQGPVDPEAALRQHGRLIVLGPPGAGKSTLLRRLARQAAADPQGPLPLPVALGRYATQLSRGDVALVDFALAGIPAQRQPAVRAAVADGRVLWLLDALDEAREAAPRVLAQLSDLRGQLVLTSRPLGYAPGPAADLAHYELLPLDASEVEQFLGNWFNALAELQGLSNDWAAERVRATQALLADRPGLHPLLGNPLLLTFVAVLASKNPTETLPSYRAGLYRRYLEELLDSWEGERRARAGAAELAIGPLRGEAARTALRDGVVWLGWWLHLTYYGGRASWSPLEREAVRALASYYRAATDYADLRQHEALAMAGDVVRFWREAGLLDVWPLRAADGPVDFLAFRHLTFQEYGAAVVLAKSWGVKGSTSERERAWAFLRPRLHVRAWREPLLLLGGLLDAAAGDALLERVLGAGSPYEGVLRRDLRLAVQLAEEGRKWRVPRRIEVAKLLAEAIVARDRNVPAWLNLLEDTLESSDLFAEPSIFLILLEALQDTRWTARWIAAGAMALTRNKAAVPVLIEYLQDPDDEVRRSSAFALGELGDVAAVPALIRLVEDEYPSVRAAALAALGQIGDPSTLPVIWQKMDDSSDTVRYEVGLLLVLLKDESTSPRLISQLQSGSQAARQVAAHALGLIGERAAVPLLLTSLRDADFYVRFRAIEALSRMRDDTVVHALLEFLRRDDGAGRASAIEVLGNLEDKAIIPALSNYIQDDSWYVRQKVAHAMGRLGDPSVVDHLFGMLQDTDSSVRREAAIALGKLGNREADDPLLNASAWDRNIDVRRWATISAAQLGNRNVIPKLIEILKDATPSFRSTAAQILGQLEDMTALPTLFWSVTDEDPLVRSACTGALKKMLTRLPPQALLGMASYLENLMPVIDMEYDSGISELLEQIASRLSLLNSVDLPADDLALLSLRADISVGST